MSWPEPPRQPHAWGSGNFWRGAFATVTVIIVVAALPSSEPP